MNPAALMCRFTRLVIAFPRLRTTSNPLDDRQSIHAKKGLSTSRWYSDNPQVQDRAFETLSAPNESKIVPKLPTSIKKLNKQLATRQSPDLPEEELEEKFVRGDFIRITAALRLDCWAEGVSSYQVVALEASPSTRHPTL